MINVTQSDRPRDRLAMTIDSEIEVACHERHVRVEIFLQIPHDHFELSYSGP
jgi:hypothetical protein